MKNNKNIKFVSDQIAKFYSLNRRRWALLYPSERWVFEKIAGEKRRIGDILDVGCACGGLKTALEEKFEISSYTGVDINKEAVNWARKKHNSSAPSRFFSCDIINLKLRNKFDMVVSLSCADWNIETKRIILSCWDRVRNSGYFVISVRLTPNKGINNLKLSYQRINFNGRERNPELANYVVFNFKDFLNLLHELKPSPVLIGAYGYWGKPSSMAVTPFKKLLFAVFYLKKGRQSFCIDEQKCEFTLPLNAIIKS